MCCYMVIVELHGALGNQISEYAVGRCLAHKLNTELKLNFRGRFKEPAPGRRDHYRLGAFNIQESFATPEEVDYVRKTGKRILTLKDPQNFQGDIFIPPLYLPNDEYFSDIADILQKEFTFKASLSPKAETWRKKILSNECSVSLHFRRTDFLHAFTVQIWGSLSTDYYETCIKQLKEMYPNVTAFIFSDDLQWVKENLRLDVPTEFVEGCETDDEDFYLMTLCKHNILANSTFSWWAGYLNTNPDKSLDDMSGFLCLLKNL